MLWALFFILAVVILLFLLCVIFVVYQRHYWKFLGVPHESPKKFLKLVEAIRKHTGAEEREEEHYKELYARFKSTNAPFCGFYHLLQPRALILDRELVKRILITDFSNFNSRGVYYNTRDDPLSADLWSRSGSTWKQMRLKTDPIFRKEQMRHLFSCIYAESEQLLNFIFKSFNDNFTEDTPHFIEIKRSTRSYVLSSIAACVFGLSTKELKQKYPLEEFEAATELALRTQRHDVVMNFMLTRYYNLARKMGFSVTNRAVSAYFTALIEDVVAQREKSTDVPLDYLQMLIDIRTEELSTHETDENFNAEALNRHLWNELVSQAIGFLKSGFEPTANTLAFVLHELALNNWAQDKARQEVMQTMEKYNNELNFECVQELKFMGQIISETIRLHPVSPFLVRRTLNDYHLPTDSKFFLRKDMFVIIPTHAMHNDPENFSEPHLFKPERFSETENKSREQCLWLGFGEGARSCIGLRFAQLQIRIVVARLLLKYKFSLNPTRIVTKHSPELYLQLNLLTRETIDQNTEEVEQTEALSG